MAEGGEFSGPRHRSDPPAGGPLSNAMSGSVDGINLQAGSVGDVYLGTPVPPEHWVPRQLPRSSAHFVNRVTEFAVLDEWWLGRGDRGLIAALTGAGGIGKTAFGTWWLQHDGARFPGGHLYVDLGGPTHDTALSTSEALGRFLRALGVPPDRIPVELDERTSLYRSITAGRSLGVMLDNAFSAAQVRPLLPSSGSSTVLVTSRTRLTSLALDGAHFLDLAPLRESESVALLTETLGPERIQRERSEAVDLARLCSGFPLALVVIGARLSARPQWPLRRVVKQLQDEARRFTVLALDDQISMRTIFDDSYGDLSPTAANLYRSGSRLPVTELSVPLLAHSLEMAAEEIEFALEELADAHLMYEPAPGRYGYHDLLRAHAQGVSESEDDPKRSRSALLRATDWYLGELIDADLAVNPFRRRLGPGFADRIRETTFGSAESALLWCERERPHIMSLFAAAEHNGWDEHLWQLCEALWNFFLYRKHYSDWISTHRSGIAAASRLGHPRAETRLRCQLGFAFLDQRRFDEVTEICSAALATAEAEDDAEGMAASLEQLGKAARERGEVNLAVAHFRRALALANRTGRVRAIAIQSRFLGGALADLHRYDEAVAHLEHSVALLQEIGDGRGCARALTEIGRIRRTRGDLSSAEAELQRALSLMRDSTSPSYQAEVLVELAECAHQLGAPVRALALLQDAASLYLAAQHPRLEEVRNRVVAMQALAEAAPEER
ncbi:tetratricopeptide repeat protein [Saccharopolyspora sp. NFXS83]|uniref:tetratricopeptide repeat protein n=1 Tax=Saccharopolyspora sp. NFXS83 TaxID=2993560 RepID=UPI00224B5972|nr:tetratricopeptide repeat protein [Saccharopolyspora sp. NFXS83]MCX2731479.1 tetratricopeptide repeat protein [Saccharopolyspora sp. NFXS83]